MEKDSFSIEKDSFSVQEFCVRHGISRSALYNALKAGQGPRLMRVGSRILVSKEAAEAWRREREQASEQVTVAPKLETSARESA
jgi:predicted DNA-binding transcriptional regulator AlpA